jgi:hypothetical protein
LSLGLAALLAVAAAAEPPPRIRASELRAPTLALAERLLGEADPRLIEVSTSWWPGVAQYSGVSVLFAQRPKAAGWAGLCRVEIRWAELRFVEPRERDEELTVSGTGRDQGYLLASPAPTLRPVHPDGEEAACAGLTPLLPDRHWPTQIRTGERPASDAEAVFAYHALLAARKARDIRRATCSDSSAPICLDPRRFLESFDPRNVQRLGLAPCREDPKHLCVTASLDNPGRGGGSIIVVETGAPAVPAYPTAPPHIRRVRVDAEIYPVA